MERDKVKVIQIRANDRIQKECYGNQDKMKNPPKALYVW